MPNPIISWGAEFWGCICRWVFTHENEHHHDHEAARNRTTTSTYQSTYYSPLPTQTDKNLSSWCSDKDRESKSNASMSPDSSQFLSSISKSNASKTDSLPYEFIPKHISSPLVRPNKSTSSRSSSNSFSREPVPSYTPLTRQTETESPSKDLERKSTFLASPSHDSRFLSSVARSNASTSSPDTLQHLNSSCYIYHLKSKPISPPPVQTDISNSSSSPTKSFSSTSVSSPGCPSNDWESPKKDQQGTIPRFEIPKHMQELIKNGIVPPVLKKPLSPSTYGDYFAALLYAEDFYCEKWSDYLLEDVNLELLSKESFFQSQSSNRNNNPNSNRNKNKKKNSNTEKDEYFVTFKIDAVPERRPYLLSRDHVLLRPTGKEKHCEPFQGVLNRVVKTKTVLADFQNNFHKQHKESNTYDISFSFNRVCLKRAHRAVSATTNPLLLQILFPKPNLNAYINNQMDQTGQVFLINRILKYKGAIPYLIEGPLSDTFNGDLTHMGSTIKEAIFQIYKNFNGSRVLICAPRNRTCDALMRGIMGKVDEFDLFRANAAFRDADEVPDDILKTTRFKGECFTCPPLHELQKFRIITSTFISTYRLYDAGIKSGHFTHIFLVDASSCIEPEVIVSLTDLVSEDTILVVTGSERDEPIWVRSDIGRRNGLKKSFFKRLLEREPYCTDDPMFVTHIN